MKELAQEIVDIFEFNPPICTTKDDWKYDAEDISLYLAAKRYLEHYN